ncbi:MAG TPA: hypothetical protein VIL57_08860 [Bacteroidia bacterium]
MLSLVTKDLIKGISTLVLTSVLISCGNVPAENEIRIQKSDYVLPFKLQYNNTLSEIKGLESKIENLNNAFLRYENENTQKFKAAEKKKNEFDTEFAKITEKIKQIQYDLESTIPGYSDGKFCFDSIPNPHSNEKNSSYFKGFTNSVAAELAISIKKLNKNLTNTKYLLNKEDTSGIYIFQEIIDPTSPNSPDPVYWEDQSLIYAPMVGCLNELRQIERRLLQTKVSYYDYLVSQLQQSVYTFSDISPYMYADNSHIKVGETAKIRLGLKAWTNSADFHYIIDGDTIKNVKNGEAIYNFKAEEAGYKKINGIISYIDPETGEEKQTSFFYNIKVDNK